MQLVPLPVAGAGKWNKQGKALCLLASHRCHCKAQWAMNQDRTHFPGSLLASLFSIHPFSSTPVVL